MGLFGFVKDEVRQMAIARPDEFKRLVIYKHPDETVPKWAQLTVDSDEGAVFFRDGRVHGILGAGRHTLDAAMYPFLTGLVDKYGGGDVFKSEVYFINTQPLRNDPLKFGGRTDSIIDPGTDMPCSPRIFGESVVRVMDPVKFILYVGQARQAHDNAEILKYIADKMRSAAKTALVDVLNEQMTSVLEIGRSRNLIGERLEKGVPDLDEIGVVVTELIDFSCTLPPEEKEELMEVWKTTKIMLRKKKAEIEARKMDVEVDLAERQAYVNMANQNPGYMAHAQAEALMGAGQGMAKGGGDGAGLAGMGAQMAVGVGMAGMFQQGFQAPQYQRAQPPQQGGTIPCQACGAPNGGGKFCNNCGQPLAPPKPVGGGFCSNCGQGLAPGAKFCANCGTQTAPQGGPPPQGAPPQGGGYPPAGGGYPPAGGAPPQGGPQGGQYAAGAPQQGYPPAQPPQGGYPPQGQPQGGYPPQGQPPQGQPQGGYPPAGQPPQGGYPPAGGGQGGQGGGQPG